MSFCNNKKYLTCANIQVISPNETITVSKSGNCIISVDVNPNILNGTSGTSGVSGTSGTSGAGGVAGSSGTSGTSGVGANTVNQTTFSADGLTLVFNIPHGLAGTPKAIVMAASEDASNIYYITTDATNVIVNYSVAPPAGTNNIIINWIANL